MESKHKRKRADAKKNNIKVIKSVIKKPLQSIAEIAKETGLSVGNVHNKLKNLEGVKVPSIEEICATDIENVKLGQAILNKRLKEQSESLKVREIVDITAESTKRYTIFKGNITDKEGGMNKILTQEQMDKLLERLKIDE